MSQLNGGETSGSADWAQSRIASGVRHRPKQAIIGNRHILADGDMITAVDETAVANWGDLTEYLERYTQVGDTLLTLLRNGCTLEVETTPAVQP